MGRINISIIFRKNLLLAIAYTIAFIGIAWLADKQVSLIILDVIYPLVAVVHFITCGLLMMIYHFRADSIQLKGYRASFIFIWVLLVTVKVLFFYLVI